MFRIPQSIATTLACGLIVATFLTTIRMFHSSHGAYAQNLTPASATLSNPRLSFKAAAQGSHPAGSATITIQSVGQPDVSTAHLYTNDSVCFIPSGQITCLDGREYVVDRVVGDSLSTQFILKTPLQSPLSHGDLIVRVERTSLAITFTSDQEIPATGDILLEIPASAAGDGCDGIPDSAASTSEGGFDMGPPEARIGPDDIVVTGCNNNNWVETETITCGTSGSNHTIRIDRKNSACPAGSKVTIIIDKNPGLIIPAPILDNHTVGTADIYAIDVTTRDEDGTRLDTVDMQVAPVDSVFVVTAQVPETLTFSTSGVSSDTAACGDGVPIRVSTTADQVPFGVFTRANEFKEGAQRIVASTNAPSGYSITLHENDQMGRDGKSCPGPTAGEAEACIKDSTCDSGTCTEKTASESDWTNPAAHGLAFSLANLRGNDATFLYNGTSGTCISASPHPFCARQIPDLEAGEAPSVIMRHEGPTDDAEAYACYRLTVSHTQPAGFYFNHITYTALPNF